MSSLPGSQPMATARSCTSCEASTLPGSHFPGVQDLAAQRQDRLEVLVARLLGAAAGRVAFDQEQLGARQVLADAVGQLAGQGRALGDLLADDLLLGLQPRRGALDGQLRDLLADLGVLVEPQAEGVVRGALDEARGLARGQAFLGLAAELRVGHLQRQHEGDPVPHVLRRQLDAARQQVAEVAELAQRVGEAGAQAVDVGAVLRGGDQVDVAFLHQLAFRQPGHRPVHDLGVLVQAADEQLRRQQLAAVQLALQVVAQAVLVIPLARARRWPRRTGCTVRPGQSTALARSRCLSARRLNFGVSKYFGSGQKRSAGAGVLLADACRPPPAAMARSPSRERHAVFVAVALDEHVDPGRQRIDHADADAVQAAGEGVVLVAELAAGVQPGEDQLDAGDLLLRVDVHRHAAAVVGHLAAAVGVQGHLDAARVPGQRLVHRVVDHLLRQVVRAAWCRCTCRAGA